MKNPIIYPLVSCPITIENHHFQWVKIAIFNSFLYVYQTVVVSPVLWFRTPCPSGCRSHGPPRRPGPLTRHRSGVPSHTFNTRVMGKIQAMVITGY